MSATRRFIWFMVISHGVWFCVAIPTGLATWWDFGGAVVVHLATLLMIYKLDKAFPASPTRKNRKRTKRTKRERRASPPDYGYRSPWDRPRAFPDIERRKWPPEEVQDQEGSPEPSRAHDNPATEVVASEEEIAARFRAEFPDFPFPVDPLLEKMRQHPPA